MSAPGIPDLRTLLRSNRPSRRGGRIQGRGNRGSVAAANDDPSGLSSSRDINNNLDNTLQSQNGNTKDHIVQQTDRDATFSRVSAVESGYLEDPFAKCFLEAGETVERRFPIINRGVLFYFVLLCYPVMGNYFHIRIFYSDLCECWRYPFCPIPLHWMGGIRRVVFRLLEDQCKGSAEKTQNACTNRMDVTKRH